MGYRRARHNDAVTQLQLWPDQADLVAQPLQLVDLPGLDWADQEPYRSERRKGRPMSCPAIIVDDAGQLLRYVGGLVDGAPRYEPYGGTP